ncbi:MAG: hypothetical protein PHD67_08715 [Oscillospiraceae bacterium]|nr:hypothetical protein [Oscillospiraceae bacterium]
MEEIKIARVRSTKPHRCHLCGETIPAREPATKYTRTITTYTCMSCETSGLPSGRKTNFDQIAASPEALAAFLGSLSVSANDPWDDAFQRAFCDGCPAEDCDAAPCPHQEERDNPAWWLAQEVQA